MDSVSLMGGAAQDRAGWRQVVYGLCFTDGRGQHKTELDGDKWSMDSVSLMDGAAQDRAGWRQVVYGLCFTEKA